MPVINVTTTTLMRSFLCALFFEPSSTCIISIRSFLKYTTAGDYRTYLHERAKSVCLLECELEEIR